MERLFVLAGKARSGKDTTADYMEKYYKNKKIIRLMYGSGVKIYATLLSDWDGREESKPRELLQKIAVESREVNPNYTIKRMFEDINILKDYCDVIIITDARMPEEVLMPKQKFKEAVTIKIERPNFESPLSASQQKSLTEIALDNFNDYDYIVSNDGTLEDLDKRIINLLESEGL